jgi:hypothetical protein
LVTANVRIQHQGLPFFWTDIPGADDEHKDGAVAKNAYKYHKLAGEALV